MPFTARDVLRRVTITLQDADAVRWTYPELLMWLNDGTREIALMKPNAVGVTINMPLVEGTKQEIPDTAHALLKVVRNVNPETEAGLSVITPIVRQVLDQQMPGWHDSTVIPFAAGYTILAVCWSLSLRSSPCSPASMHTSGCYR